MKPKIAVLYAPGTNCHRETAYAIETAGGESDIVVLHDLLSGESDMSVYDGLAIPGGFSFGDHIAAGRVFSTYLVARFGDELRSFINRKKPVVGICNGDQILMESGLLPHGDVGDRTTALTQNRSARFESRWVRLRVENTGSFWTRGMEGRIIRIPVAHAEGRLYHDKDHQVKPAFLYVDDQNLPTQSYPDNPAGSPEAVAGVVDSNGTVIGMMPHPERAISKEHGSTDGLQLFKNMIYYCNNN